MQGKKEASKKGKKGGMKGGEEGRTDKKPYLWKWKHLEIQ